jgi:energy-coupling factor transporter ATP-binding protein EcfA2
MLSSLTFQKSDLFVFFVELNTLFTDRVLEYLQFGCETIDHLLIDMRVMRVLLFLSLLRYQNRSVFLIVG